MNTEPKHKRIRGEFIALAQVSVFGLIALVFAGVSLAYLIPLGLLGGIAGTWLVRRGMGW